MAKNPSNGNIRVAWALSTSIVNDEFPTDVELNAALNLTPAIAWSDYEVGAGDSGDLDDRSLEDLGNAVSRGAASYSATLAMFRDINNVDLSSIYVQAFEAFRVERTVGYLFVRVNKLGSLPFAPGDEISVYKLLADTTADDTEGEDSTKFSVQFLAQGLLHVHTQVAGAGVITGVAPTVDLTVAGLPFQLEPVAGGASIKSRAEYTSADNTVAVVDEGGVIRPISAGTAEIEVAWGAATGPVTTTVTVAA